MIFKEKEDDLVVGLELDPCPTILITLEKFKEQCGSRKKIPNVSVLGKHVAFRMIENKFQKKWAKKNCFGEGTYGLPGGHLEYGEKMIDGAKRELL